ncbi:MAG: segregation and condensation protein A [Vicinamibacteria bacterium]
MMESPMQVKLDVFEGPLDLLLHLIREHELNIWDIPIALIAEEYMATLDLMKTLNLDLAGEFLEMAATLAWIKSRMLLPPDETEESEEGDPRADLVAQLLEYQRFKEAADELESRPQLHRDLFIRGAEPEAFPPPEDGTPLVEVGLFELMEAFRRLWEKMPEDVVHEITVDRITLQDKIHELLERLTASESLSFEELLSPETTRRGMVLSFLALLELARLRVVRVMQATAFGTIRIERAVAAFPDERTILAATREDDAGEGGEEVPGREGGPEGGGKSDG